MKKNKLFLFIAMVTAVLVVLTACSTNNSNNTNNDDSAPGIARPMPELIDPDLIPELVDVHVVLIGHSPASSLNDGSFNQGAYDGILRFAESFPDTVHQFMQPTESSDEAHINAIEMAIESGANVIVLPGLHFATSLYVAQDMFPETKFIILDASPRNPETNQVRVEPNVAAVHYAEEQAGFLAGYAAVMEGYQSLGFMGGAPVPAVTRFGSGFVQGAEFAAVTLGMDPGQVTIEYHYLGGFQPAPEHLTRAASWFAAGTEVIFVAAGGAGMSVMAAAEAEGGAVIGVDVDQYHLSETIITSALKGLDVSVYDLLVSFTNGFFFGGFENRLEAHSGGVALAMDTARLTNFSQAQYESILLRLINGEITVDNTDTPGFMPEVFLVTVNVQ